MKLIRDIFFILVFGLTLFSACDKYDTDVMGENFTPYNSLVTRYKQLVYVEYREGKAKVWGPYAKLVDADINGLDVSISSSLDSLVVLAYGNSGEEAGPGSITINSTNSYAIYFSGLNLNNESGTTFKSLGTETCFLVLPTKSQNNLTGSFEVASPLIIDGGGTLNIKSIDNVALSAKGGITCSYPVTINISSENNDGVRADNGEIKIADGKWNVTAGNNAFNAGQNIILNGGQIRGNAKTGSFALTPSDMGLVANETNCIAIAAKESTLGEENQFIWQDMVTEVSCKAGTAITINRLDNQDKKSKFATFTPAFSYTSPWIIVANTSLSDADWLTFE